MILTPKILAALREVADVARFDSPYDRTFRECSPGSMVAYCACQRVLALRFPSELGVIVDLPASGWRMGQCHGCGRVFVAGPMPEGEAAAAEQVVAVEDGKKGEWRG